MRRLQARLERRGFSEKPPAKNINEKYQRAKTSVMALINRGEKKIQEVGGKIDGEIERKDWKRKISGYFKPGKN